jgi:hypothetical protein
MRGRFYVVDRIFDAAELRLGATSGHRADHAIRWRRPGKGVVSDDALALPKVDPESLVIRSRPVGAIRFRRGLIIAIAAIGSVSALTIFDDRQNKGGDVTTDQHAREYLDYYLGLASDP